MLNQNFAVLLAGFLDPKQCFKGVSRPPEDQPWELGSSIDSLNPSQTYQIRNFGSQKSTFSQLHRELNTH